MKKNKWGSVFVALVLTLPLILYFAFKSISSPVFGTLPYVYKLNAAGDSLKRSLPPFQLKDRDGNTFDESILKDKISLISFFSPEDTLKNLVLNGNLERVYDNIKGTDYIQMLSVYTGELITDDAQTYMQSREESPESWIFSTGDSTHIHNLIDQLGIREQENVPIDSDKGFTAQHVVLIDKAGKLRKYFVATDLGEIRRINDDLRALTVLEYPEELKK